MPTAIEVTVPALLRDSVGGKTQFTLYADTLAAALAELQTTYPLLRVHVYDGQGQLRPHVLIFYNAESIAWLDRLDVPLKPGDQLQILQAVSGG